jgi:protein-S-isoprenylcysteine O-methyltransferase Ste14
MTKISIGLLSIIAALLMMAAVMVGFHSGLPERLSSAPHLRTLLGLALLLIGILLSIWWGRRHRAKLVLLGSAFGNCILGLVVLLSGLTEGRRSPAEDRLVIAFLLLGEIAFIALPIVGALATKEKNLESEFGR